MLNRLAASVSPGRRALQAASGRPGLARRPASTLGTTYRQHPVARLDPSDSNSPLLARVSGPTDKPLNELTFSQFWAETVQQYGERQALVSRHEPASQHAYPSSAGTSGNDDCIRWSFGEMDEHIRQLVKGLRQLGIRKGERVGILMM